jgi:hypothetical protein
VKCFDCNSTIPQARIKAVPDTEYCVECVDSHTEPTMGRMIYNHKTAGEVILARGKENIRRLNREYSRAR